VAPRYWRWWRGVVGNTFWLKRSYSTLGPVSTAMGDCLRAETAITFTRPVSISSNFLFLLSMCFTIRHEKRLGETSKLSGDPRSRPASWKRQPLVLVSSRSRRHGSQVLSRSRLRRSRAHPCYNVVVVVVIVVVVVLVLVAVVVLMVAVA